MIMALVNLQIGDRLIRPKGRIKHHGIYIGIIDGVHTVAENQRGHGVQLISYDQFMNESLGVIVRIQKFNGSETDRTNVIPRIYALLGMNYNLFFFNCEHFAELIQHGKAVSMQVGTVVIGVIVLLGFVALQAE
jgi:hypothetical protein